jgi:hypothetical protein
MTLRVHALLAAALLSVLLVGCTKTVVPGPKIDPALAGLIPQDTTTLVGLRLEALEKTDAYKKSLAKRALPQVGAFAEKTGVDPTKDLWELLYVSNGKTGALIGRGKFSDESEPRLGSKGDQRFNYKGTGFVGNEQTAILLVAPTVLAVGDTVELRAMVDAHEKSAGPPTALAGMLKDVSSQAQMWAVYGGGRIPLPDLKGNLSNVTTIVGLIQRGSFYLDFSAGMNGVAAGSAGTEKDAEQLEGGLKALVGLGRLSTPANQPELLQAWDGLRPTREGVDVKLHIEERPELVDRLLVLLLGRGSAP